MKKLLFALCFLVFLGACNSSKDTTSSTNGTTDTSSKRQQRGQKARLNVDEVFTKMDENNDGKLAKSEVKGPLEKDFSTIDTNGDGFLSRTEVENAPKPERGQRAPRN